MRKTDWRAALSQYVKTQTMRPAKAGSHDNFTFAAGCIGAMTGRDPARGLRGKYSNEAAAQKLFEGLGHLDHVDYLTADREEVPASFAQAGDLAVFAAERVVGIVSGGRVYILTEAVQHVPLSRADKFYRVI